MGAVVENIGKGREKPKGVGGVIQGGGSYGTSSQVIDVVDEPPHGPGPGEGVQHRVARWIDGKHSQRIMDGIWEYPTLETAMQESRFEEVDSYVLRRHNTAAQYIAMQPIMDLCEEMVQIPGICVAKRWW